MESVFFLVGDAGDAQFDASPILERLRQDVDWWSQRIEGDSAVVVAFLGDNVYPLGLHPRESSEFSEDSLTLMAQVRVLASPAALERANGYFMAGNHDWGLEEDWDGFERIAHLGDFLATASATTGASVRLVPEAGTGGPFVVDVGKRVRLIVLDTAWWILDGGQLGLESRPMVLSGVREAMESAGGRTVFIAAHHPFQSAGPHGGEVSFWSTLGVRYLLDRSGAMLQDITSVPYRELAGGLREIFADTGPPLLFAGGHEHSLQVFRGIEPTDPAFSTVSGSASKLSSVGDQPGMLFGRSAPGYMRIVVERDGGVTLFVEAAPRDFLDCPVEVPARTPCMTEGVDAFEVVHSQRLN